MSSSIRESEFTLNSFHMNYNSHLGDEFKLTHKCIHKQLDSEESLTLIKALVVQVMSLVSKRLAKLIKAHLMESLKDLLSLLKVKDIVLIDGTELDLRNSPAQITLSAKEKAETDLTVPTRDQGSSSMLHTLFVNKALFMLRYLKLLVQKETESTENTFRTVWLSLIEVTSMKSLSRLL